MKYLIVLLVLLIPSISSAQMNTNWSLGLGFVANVLGPSSDVYELRNGLVEVSEHGDSTIRPIIETHIAWAINDTISVGPFIGAAIEPDEIIAAIGSGVVLELTGPGGKTLTLGLGGWAERGDSLGRGLIVGQPADIIFTEQRTFYSLMAFIGGNPF